MSNAAQEAFRIFNNLSQVVSATADKERHDLYCGLSQLALAFNDLEQRLQAMESRLKNVSRG